MIWTKTSRLQPANAVTTDTAQSITGLKTLTPAAANPGLVVRGAAAQTANLTEWQTSDGTVLAHVGSGGGLHGSVVVRAGTDPGVGVLRAGPTAANIPGVVVRGAASQTANLTEWQDSTGAVLARVAANGAYANSTDYFGSPTAAQRAYLLPTTATQKGLVVQGRASQTANLQEWQDSAGNVLAGVDPAGKGIGGLAGALRVAKLADTAKVSDTTVAADPHLQMALKGGKRYIIQINPMLNPSGLLTLFVRMNYTGTYTAAGTHWTMPGSQGGSYQNTTRIWNNTISGPSIAPIFAILETTGDGTMSFDWAQSSSNTTAATLLRGSWMTVQEV